MVCSSVTIRLKNAICFSGSAQRQMSNRICNVILRVPSSLCFLHISNSHRELKFSLMPASRKNSYSSFVDPQVFRGGCFGFSVSNQKSGCSLLTVRSMHNHRSSPRTCFDMSLRSHKSKLQLLVPRQARIHLSQWTASAWLFIGLLVCYSSSKPVHAYASDTKEDKGEQCDSSSVYSHGKKVCTDYSVIGIPGDGRCLFRSVAHGASVRAGKSAPDESLQRELADELRAKVADEFVKRRKETEWFIEGDFDAYISQMRKPHVWGGEPELLMASHVLQMPISVYMHDRDSGGLISIAEYGQEYGKDNPIKVLYHGFGHYDALQIPGKKNARSKL